MVVMKAYIYRNTYDPSKSRLQTWIDKIAWRVVYDYLKDRSVKNKSWEYDYEDYSEFNNRVDTTDTTGDQYVDRFVITDSIDEEYSAESQRGPESDLIISDQKDLVRKILDEHFEQRDRDLYNYLVQDLENDEIARRLGITLSNLYTRKNRLISQLRDYARAAA